jgi:hypothetical protein
VIETLAPMSVNEPTIVSAASGKKLFWQNQGDLQRQPAQSRRARSRYQLLRDMPPPKI